VSISSPLTQVVIHSLTRIQNYAIWPFYALTRKAMADRYGGDPNEKLLFHGARVRANMDAITNFGSEHRQGCRDGCHYHRVGAGDAGAGLGFLATSFLGTMFTGGA